MEFELVYNDVQHVSHYNIGTFLKKHVINKYSKREFKRRHDWEVYTTTMISSVVFGDTRGGMVIVEGNGHGNMSSSTGQGWLQVTKH